MKKDLNGSHVRRKREGGFSILEIVIVVFVVLVVMAVAVPNVMVAVANVRLRASAGDLAGLMQQARMMAAKNNPQNPPVYAILYGVKNGRQIAYIDLNGDGNWSSSVTVNGVTLGEPLVEFSGTVVPAAGAPTAGAGVPGPYVHAKGLPLRLHKPANLQHSGGEVFRVLPHGHTCWRSGLGGSGYNQGRTDQSC